VLQEASMGRIPTVEPEDATAGQRAAHDDGVKRYGRMTNMKRTLLHSLPAFHALMEFYPLADVVEPFLGARAMNVFLHAISAETDCLVCSTYFRRHLIDAGDDPDNLELSEREELLAEFGRSLSTQNSRVSDDVYARLAAEFTAEQIVALTAFGAMMVATNVFNNALEVDLDEYLEGYRKPGARAHGAVE
jgi:alkylhydroperoxidase family enzyme